MTCTPVYIVLLLIYELCFRDVLAGHVTLQTFNTGLIQQIPNYPTRKAAVAQKLQQGKADVICLQEVWSGNDVADIVGMLRLQYPYYQSSIPDEARTIAAQLWPPCLNIGAFRSLQCMSKLCIGIKSPAKLVACGHHCGLLDLPPQCASCFISSGISQVVKTCFLGFGVVMNPSGLLLLSSRPMRHPEVVNFHKGAKTVIPRSYIRAEVDGIGDVLCTHTSADLGKIYYEPYLQTKFKSWEEQGKHETQMILDAVRATPKTIIMGDLNSSPALEKHQVSYSFIDVYNMYITENFTSPYVKMVGECTYCSNNPLVPYNSSHILDHILIRGSTATAAQLLYGGNIPGQPYPLSDHYGVQITVEET